MIDRPVWPGRGRRWSHLSSDVSLDELHAFARAVGVPERAFERDHYDVPSERYDELVRAGAEPVSSRELVRRLIDAQLRRRQPRPVRDVDWSTRAEPMGVEHDVERQLNAEMADWLARDGVRRVVDVGCGTGGVTVALARAMPTAQVIGVDAEPAMRAAALARARTLGLGARFVAGDLNHGLSDVDGIERGRLDLVWASAVVHHMPHQQAAVNSLARLLAPGGRLALAEGGLRMRSLPWDLGIGRPGLEMRLDAALDDWFGRMRAALPASVPMPYGWDVALRRAGLGEICRRSFLLELPPPLPTSAVAYVVDRLRALIEQPQRRALLDPEDAATVAALIDRDDPAYVGHRDDVFLLVARTVYVGTKPERATTEGRPAEPGRPAVPGAE